MSPFVRNVLIIARREYVTRVRNRAFAFLMGAVAALALLVTLLPVVLGGLDAGPGARIVVASSVPDLPAEPAITLSAGLAASGAGESFTFTTTDDPEAARGQVRAGALDGLLSISRDASGDLSFDYFSKERTGGRSTTLIRAAASALAVQDRLARAGLAPADQARLFLPAPFRVTPAEPGAAGSEDDRAREGVVAFGFVILIFMSIITYGNWVAVGVAEEKGSRVMELLIQAATPNQLLAGKVLGAGGAALTQYFALVLAGGVGLLLQGPLERALGTGSGGELPQLSLSAPLLLTFGAYFLLGYAVYAALYAAAGSLVSRQQDAQQVGTPISLVAVFGYVASTFAVQAPDAPWSVVLSFVPFTSPFFMLVRLVLGRVEPWEVALSLAVLVAGLVLMLWLAARIYRAGVLLYGQRPSIGSLVRAVRGAG